MMPERASAKTDPVHQMTFECCCINCISFFCIKWSACVCRVHLCCLITLCRRSDVGKPKAVVAADFINRRVAGCNVTAYLLCCFLSFLVLPVISRSMEPLPFCHYVRFCYFRLCPLASNPDSLWAASLFCVTVVDIIFCLQCFDAVGWAAARASGL